MILNNQLKNFSVVGADLKLWRQGARRSAQLHQIPLAEVDWLLQELGDLTALELRLESFADRPSNT